MDQLVTGWLTRYLDPEFQVHEEKMAHNTHYLASDAKIK